MWHPLTAPCAQGPSELAPLLVERRAIERCNAREPFRLPVALVLEEQIHVGVPRPPSDSGRAFGAGRYAAAGGRGAGGSEVDPFSVSPPCSFRAKAGRS